jgi:hypothetical protein
LTSCGSSSSEVARSQRLTLVIGGSSPILNMPSASFPRAQRCLHRFGAADHSAELDDRDSVSGAFHAELTEEHRGA